MTQPSAHGVWRATPLLVGDRIRDRWDLGAHGDIANDGGKGMEAIGGLVEHPVAFNPTEDLDVAGQRPLGFWPC